MDDVATADLDDQCFAAGCNVTVNVEIDQEDDDVFFSLHRAPHAALDEEAEDLMEDDCSAQNKHEFPAMMEEARAVDDWATEVECLPIVESTSAGENMPLTPQASSALPIRGANCLDAVVLQPVAVETSSGQHAVQGGFLADLKRGRAQGVRNYLAKKLNQDTEEQDQAC
jgi:hypothetical protein